MTPDFESLLPMIFGLKPKGDKMTKTELLVSVVKNSLKELAGEAEMRVSGEFYEAADRAVTFLISQAIERAKANGRQTLQPQDL